VAAFLGMPWLATRRKGLRSLRDDFGLWWRPVDLAIGLGFGIVGLVAAAIAGGLVDAAFGADEATSNIPVDSLERTRGQIIAFFHRGGARHAADRGAVLPWADLPQPAQAGRVHRLGDRMDDRSCSSCHT
jgi:hypothetical protein